MKLRRLLLALSFAALVAVALSGVAQAAQGEDLHVVNKTGHTVAVFLFQDDHPHMDPAGGIQWGTLANGQTKTAHVPNCDFGILLWDSKTDDVWHAEVDDCHSDTLTFTADTGHDKRHK